MITHLNTYLDLESYSDSHPENYLDSYLNSDQVGYLDSHQNGYVANYPDQDSYSHALHLQKKWVRTHPNCTG